MNNEPTALPRHAEGWVLSWRVLKSKAKAKSSWVLIWFFYGIHMALHGSDNLTVVLGEPDSEPLSTMMMIFLYWRHTFLVHSTVSTNISLPKKHIWPLGRDPAWERKQRWEGPPRKGASDSPHLQCLWQHHPMMHLNFWHLSPPSVCS